MTPKLRAWDNGMEMMVYQGDDEIYICFDGERWKLLDYSRTLLETDEYGMNEIEQPWEVGNIEIMQYTGLKDKKGVEIYEGDVLFHPLQGRRKVYYPYSENVASYGLRDIDNGFGSTLRDSHAVWEIIGNIYENPELLED